MNKKVTTIIVTICALALIVLIIVGFNTFIVKKEVSNLNVKSQEDLTALVDQIYEDLAIELPMLQTMPIETTDADMVKSFSGLDSTEKIEYLVVSEPMMTSQAYSLVLLKVKDGVNADEVAKTMNENIDTRKWICVTAEKVYTVASGDVVCLVMSNEETAKTVYESFKSIAGTVKQEYVRVEAEPELPEDMLTGGEMDVY